MVKNKESKTAIASLCTGWAIPILGLVLGIIALINAENKEAKKMSKFGIAEAIVAWIIWTIILL